MNTPDRTDRRRSPRTPDLTPCRLLDPRTGRFLSAETRDRSAGGARLIVRTPRRFEHGQGVALLMPTGLRQGVLTAGKANRAIVRRAIEIAGDRQELAIEYENAANLAA